MITIPLSGNDKYTAIAKMQIAEAIGKQDAREIAIYISHCKDDSNTSLVVMARRLPYQINAWEVHGPQEQREREINRLTNEIQTAYADLKAQGNGN